MRRFAGQRLLAERPQEVITDDIADALLALVEQSEERSRIKGGGEWVSHTSRSKAK